MSARSAKARAARLFVALLLSLGSSIANAAPPLPPVETFVRAARERDASLGARREDAAAADREHDAAWLALSPRLSATAAYTRNQEEIAVALPTDGGTQTIVITPRDQADLTLRASVALVDVPAWSRIASTDDARDGAALAVRTAERQLEEDVVMAYYDYVGTDALADAARRGVEVARVSLSVARSRREAGLASDLDEQRAARDLAERERLVVEAEDEHARARRRLARTSGLAVEGRAAAVEVDRAAPPELDALLPRAAGRADVAGARADADRAGAEATGTWSALVPRLEASVSERFTNAAGFGVSPAWSAGASATWSLDAGVIGQGRARDARVRAARLREVDALRDAMDEVRDRHADVVVRRAALVAAEHATATAKKAAEVARARDAAGTATTLDRLLAERDELAAEVEEARARARLGLAQALLQLSVRP